jgi:hypothetical protein
MSDTMIIGLKKLGYNIRKAKDLLILEGNYEKRKDVVIGGKYRFRYSQKRNIWILA